MENKLFVGNLPWAATEQDLQDLFSQAGTVTEVTVMRDKFTGRARGFAFVLMSSDEEALEAVRRLEGQDFMGRPLKVNVARPLDADAPRRSFSNGPRRPGGGGGYSGGGHGGHSSGGHGGSGFRPRGRREFSRD